MAVTRSELTLIVGPPAVSESVRGHPAGVSAPCADGVELLSHRHGRGHESVQGLPIPELMRSTPPPAVGWPPEVSTTSEMIAGAYECHGIPHDQYGRGLHGRIRLPGPQGPTSSVPPAVDSECVDVSGRATRMAPPRADVQELEVSGDLHRGSRILGLTIPQLPQRPVTPAETLEAVGDPAGVSSSSAGGDGDGHLPEGVPACDRHRRKLVRTSN